MTASIKIVTAEDLPELLPLMRGYSDFYEVSPSDEALLAVSSALLADPGDRAQYLARGEGGRAVGFATLYWTWSTLDASPNRRDE